MDFGFDNLFDIILTGLLSSIQSTFTLFLARQVPRRSCVTFCHNGSNRPKVILIIGGMQGIYACTRTPLPSDSVRSPWPQIEQINH